MSTQLGFSFAEQWASHPSYPDYAVSTHGRIRRETSRTSAKAGTVLKQTHDKDGYCTAQLYTGGKGRCWRVHRLVYEAFNGPIPEGLVIDHLDGNTANNRLDNLEAVTTAENVRRGFRRDGREPTGNKVTAEQVADIREARTKGARIKDLALAYNITPAAISGICTGKTWKHADGPITPSRSMARTPQNAPDDEVVKDALRRVAAGESKASVARRLGVSPPTIANWVSGRTRHRAP